MSDSTTRLLWTLANQVLNHKISNSRNGWRFKDGVRVFVNPEARCPNCEQWVSTGRIWIVNESSAQLIGSWDVRDGRVITEAEEGHPHATENRGGEICVGGNAAPSEALFTGISPGSHHHNTERWFWSLGHNCERIPKVKCAICGIRYPESGSEVYGRGKWSVCSTECFLVASQFRCTKCFGIRAFYEPEGRGLRCEKCFLDEAVPCGLCREKTLPGLSWRLGDGRLACHECQRTFVARCRRCEDLFHRDDLAHEECRECRPAPAEERIAE